RAHPDGDDPWKDDHRANDDDRRDDEAAIVATSPREERRRRTRRDVGRHVDSGASVPKGDWGIGARRHDPLPALDPGALGFFALIEHRLELGRRLLELPCWIGA